MVKTDSFEDSSTAQGLQGCDFHLSTNHVEIIREVCGLIITVCLFLRIGAPQYYSLSSLLGIP